MRSTFSWILTILQLRLLFDAFMCEHICKCWFQLSYTGQNCVDWRLATKKSKQVTQITLRFSETSLNSTFGNLFLLRWRKKDSHDSVFKFGKWITRERMQNHMIIEKKELHLKCCSAKNIVVCLWSLPRIWSVNCDIVFKHSVILFKYGAIL